MGPKVHEHMTDRPRCVTPETPVTEAAELMASEDVGSLDLGLNLAELAPEWAGGSIEAHPVGRRAYETSPEGPLASGSRLNKVERHGRGAIGPGAALRRRRRRRRGPVRRRGPRPGPRRTLAYERSGRTCPVVRSAGTELSVFRQHSSSARPSRSPSRLRCRRPPSGSAAGQATTRTRACRRTGPCTTPARRSGRWSPRR